MSPRPLMVQPMFDGLDAMAFKPKDGCDRPGLYLDECSYQAARYAVEHWHYSGNAPRSPRLVLGVWENGQFIGTLIFAYPANNHLLPIYGLGQDEGVELARIALQSHEVQVTRVIRIAIGILRKTHPALRLLVSFADQSQGHLGRIYQAGNWIYTGETIPSDEYLVGTRHFHGRALRNTRSASSYRDISAKNIQDWAQKVYHVEVTTVVGAVKFRYLYPLDAAMRRQIERLRKPYPTCVGSAVGGTSTTHVEGDGSSPIPTLPMSPTQEVQ